jgi:hypothetical protein
MKSNERILWGIAVAWLIALLVIPKGPRWGNVIDVTEYPLGYSVCVKGHLQTDCYSAEKEVYDACYVGAYWERYHCVWRDWDQRPDPPPQSK